MSTICSYISYQIISYHVLRKKITICTFAYFYLHCLYITHYIILYLYMLNIKSKYILSSCLIAYHMYILYLSIHYINYSTNEYILILYIHKHTQVCMHAYSIEKPVPLYLNLSDLIAWKL